MRMFWVRNALAVIIVTAMTVSSVLERGDVSSRGPGVETRTRNIEEGRVGLWDGDLRRRRQCKREGGGCTLISRKLAEEIPSCMIRVRLRGGGRLDDENETVEEPCTMEGQLPCATIESKGVGSAATTTSRNYSQDLLDHRLMRACRYGNASAIYPLCEQGANATACNARRTCRQSFPFDFHSWRPIHFAASFGHTKCIRRLCHLGADPNVATKQHEWTPLHFAAQDGHDASVEELLRVGANSSARTGKGSGRVTPMHLAAASGHVDVIITLSGHGAQVEPLDARDKTPASLAHAKGLNQTVQVLDKAKIAEDMFGSKHRASVEGIKLSKPGYGEYSGSDATSVTEAEPRGPSELSETQDGGFSTMGSEYSEYASAVGRHKTSETGLLESGGFRSREHSRRYVDQTGSSELLTDAGDGLMVSPCVKYNGPHLSANRLWGRYQELGESLVAESEGGHRSDLDLESEGEYRGENGYRSDLDPSCNGPGHDDGGKTQRDGLGVWDEGRGPSPGEECCEDVDVDERKQMSGQSEDADVDEGVEVCSRAGGETAYVDEQAGVGGDARSLQPRASQSKGVDEGVDDFWAEKFAALQVDGEEAEEVGDLSW